MKKTGTNREKVKELLSIQDPEKRPSAAHVARMLGITRARVGQIMKEEGLESGRAGALNASPRSVPRRRNGERTGGISMDVQKHRLGYASEMLVAADLISRGYHVFVSIAPGAIYDILAVRRRDAHIATIEVRTARRSDNGSIIQGRQLRQMPGGGSRNASSKIDHFALVLAGEPIVYEPDMPPACEIPKLSG